MESQIFSRGDNNDDSVAAIDPLHLPIASKSLRWTEPMVEALLETLVDQVRLGKRTDNSFRKDAYKAALLKVQERMIPEDYEGGYTCLEIAKLRAKVSSLKKLFAAYRKMLNEPEFESNAETGSIVADDQVWDRYLMHHPDAKPLRRAPMPYPDLCAEIFDGSIAAGTSARVSRRAAPRLEFPAVDASMALDARLRDSNTWEDLRTNSMTPTSSETSSSATTRSRKRKRRRDETGAVLLACMENILGAMKAQNARKSTVQTALEDFFIRFKHKEGAWKNEGAHALTNEGNASIWVAASKAGDRDEAMEGLFEYLMKKT